MIAFAYFEQTFYRYAKRHEQDAGWAPPVQAPGAAGPNRIEPMDPKRISSN